MNVQVKLLSDTAKMPTYGRPGDAGADLYADQSVVLLPGKRALVSTNVSLALEEGTVGLVWDRSGLAVREGLHCLAGVIDSNYRGEIKIAMLNTSDQAYQIEQGDRIAQLLIQPVHQVAFTEVDELEDSSRGDAGFGSSGK